MTKAGQLKSLFGGRKKASVEVRVGSRLQSLTDTQAQRFDELARSQAEPLQAAGGNPFEQTQYALAEAAFRLMIPEAEILGLAASGSIKLFADVSGLSGHWQRTTAANETVDSPPITLRNGYLAIPSAACKKLQTQGHATLTSFEFPGLPEPAATGLDADVLAVLSTWSGHATRFLAREPRRVTLESVVLLAPLALPGAS